MIKHLLISLPDLREVQSLSEILPGLSYLIFFLPFIVFIVYYIYKNYIQKNDFYGQPFNPNIIVLASIIIKGDEKVTHSELNYVKGVLTKTVSQKRADKYYKYLSEVLNSELNLNNVIDATNRYLIKDINGNYKLNSESRRVKTKWMYFLISVAVSDRVLTNKEFAILEKIRDGWGFPISIFKSLLAMFNYYTEEDLNRKKQVKIYQKNNYVKYYLILEIDETATEKQIKAAHRKLVSLYHPDKNIKASPEEINLAKQKFQAVQEAYEKIKQHKSLKK
jgi:DnaJ like chaperone protein